MTGFAKSLWTPGLLIIFVLVLLLGKPSAQQLTPDQIDKLIQSKQNDHAQFLRNIESEEARSPDIRQTGLSPGLEEALPNPRGLYSGWSGFLDGQYYTVWAGYGFADPLRGLIIVEGSKEHAGGDYYPSKATGPLEIISENNGVLTLKSNAGKFPADDRNTFEDKNGLSKENKSTQPPGGVKYYFNIRNRKFE